MLKNLKRKYRQSLLEKVLLSLEDQGTPDKFIKSLNIKECIYMVVEAWENIE